MVMAATTTTNSQGKRLATKSPVAKLTMHPELLCFICLPPIPHTTQDIKKRSKIF